MYFLLSSTDGDLWPSPAAVAARPLIAGKETTEKKEIRQEGRADSAQSERGDLKGFVRPSYRPSLKVARSYASQKGD